MNSCLQLKQYFTPCWLATCAFIDIEVIWVFLFFLLVVVFQALNSKLKVF